MSPGGGSDKTGYTWASAVEVDDVPRCLLPAVELLSDHGFTLVESGQRALPKYGYPIVVSVSYSFLLLEPGA